MHEDQIVELLRREGPLTGSELVERTRGSALELWRTCYGSRQIHAELVGRRYLRLDRNVDGHARLSPSIRRQFLTYTVLGLVGEEQPALERAGSLTADAARISREKTSLARESMMSVLESMQWPSSLLDQLTCLIGGDVTYDMAHRVPRPEHSSDRLVDGSDLDVIIVVTDDFPTECLQALDQAVHRRKYYLLTSPSHREELDYIIKRLATVRAQLAFDTFEHMIAAKILDEGEHLCGSRSLFDQIKAEVAASGVGEQIKEMTARAQVDRQESVAHLLQTTEDQRSGAHFNLFYTSEEGDEIY